MSGFLKFVGGAGLAVLGEEEVGAVRTRLYPRVRDLVADGLLLLP